MKTVFSGIQPSGSVHLGNILGALVNWKRMQDQYNCYYCIVDLHSLTTFPDKGLLRKDKIDTIKSLMAVGINPDRSIIYFQSDLHHHAELSWILSNFCQIGELQRMTQYKDKSESFGTHAGLFTYPVLMAADILIHKADEVPVGDDQTQHLELTRDIALRFNQKYEDIFPVPSPNSTETGARVMSLRHPESKMSKSSDDVSGTIYITDDDKEIIKKIKTSVTDSENTISFNKEKKPGLANLLEILASISGMSIEETVKEVSGMQYGDFKMRVAEDLITFMSPIREEYLSLTDKKILEIANEGRDKAKITADKTLLEVKNCLGI